MIGFYLFLFFSLVSGISIQGGGASFPNLQYQEFIVEFEQQDPTQTSALDYLSSSSGTGRSLYLAPNFAYDFPGSDAPLSNTEFAKGNNLTTNCSLGEVVQYIGVLGGVSVIVNLPGVTTGLFFLDGPTIAQIYLGNITMWNDSQIASLNPDVPLPGEVIIPVARSDSSGTTSAFTDFLSRSAPTIWMIGVSSLPPWGRFVLVGPGSEGVAGLVGSNVYSIGYVAASYVDQDQVAEASVKNSNGNYNSPNLVPEAVTIAGQNAFSAGGTFSGLKGTDNLNAKSIVWPSGPTAYAISQFSYLLIHSNLSCFYGGNSDKASLLLAWLEFISEADPINGFVPLPDGAKAFNAASRTLLLSMAPPGTNPKKYLQSGASFVSPSLVMVLLPIILLHNIFIYLAF